MSKCILVKDYQTYDYKAEQLKFLVNELQNCEHTYCLVVGHHPIYSIGSHGPEEKSDIFYNILYENCFFIEGKQNYIAFLNMISFE